MISELRLILSSITGSVASLTWSIVMMLLIFFMFGTVFTQSVARHLYDISNGTVEDDPDVTARMVASFGSVQASIRSLFMSCTGGEDWKNYYELLGITGMFSTGVFLFFIAFTNIALLNILTGLFIESALKLAEPDHESKALSLRKQQIRSIVHLTNLCAEHLDSGDGTIDPERFANAMAENGSMRAYLEALGLEVFDVDLFFRMLQEASPETDVPIDSFVQGCMRMRGNASSLDMQALSFQSKADYRSLARKLGRLEKRLEELLASDEEDEEEVAVASMQPHQQP
jgi:hypothetical protein